MGIISTILAALLVSLITWLLKKIVEGRKISKWKKEETKTKLLKLGLSRDEEYNYIKSPNFIATHGQYEGPHENDEIIISENRFPLVDKLLKAFSKKDSIEKKRYAILGGSGMGKTTFAASFIYNYYKKGAFKKPKYPLYVFYLGNPFVLDEIQQIHDDESILLLDALDENAEAARNLGAFMDKLEIITNNFRHVVITSRTQFFSDKNSEPSQSSVFQNNLNKQALRYEVIYISPFSREERELFLGLKFKIPSKEYSKAHQLLERSETLMARPMVLSFIEDLLPLANNRNVTNVEIYMKIIDSWFGRECSNQTNITIQELYTFSKLLSKFIYDKWKENSVSYISAQEYENFLKDNGYNSSPYSFKDRSLLNRRSDGSIKFAHRSIWEFFLAIYSLENPQLKFDPEGIETASVFARELYALYLNRQSFPNIQFPCHDFKEVFDITDPLFWEFLSKFDKIAHYNNITEEKRKELLLKSLYRTWEAFVYRYPLSHFNIMHTLDQLLMKIEESKKSDPSKTMLYQKYYDNIIELYENAFLSGLCDIQSCFLKSNNDEIFDMLIPIEKYIVSLSDELLAADCFIQTGKEIQKGERYLFYNPNVPNTYLKDIYVFPYLTGLNDDIIKAILLNKYICLSFGISNKSSLIKTIEKLIKYHCHLGSVYIFWDAPNIDEYIDLVMYITSNIKILSTEIFVRINIDNNIIFYAINKYSFNYKEDEIRKIVNNMLENKKETGEYKIY